MRKRYWSAAAAILIIFGSVLPVYAEENTEETVEETVEEIQVINGTWKQDSKGWWYDKGDGTYAREEFLEIKGETYYFRGSGYMVTGWQVIGSDWYCFTSSGAMMTSRWAGNYYLKEDGRMAVNEWVDNNTAYVGKDGRKIENYGIPSWKQDSKGWWYDKGDGTYAKEEFLEIKGETYYFRGSGYMVTGWQVIGSDWYCFTSSGAMMASRWAGNYYLKEDGRMAVNEWVDNNTAYVGKDGRKIENYGIPSWKQDSKGWWYDKGDGTYAREEFLEIKGETYYFRGSGYMVTGWQVIGSDWYCFTSSGAMMTSRWAGNYYLKEDGRMAVNEWVDNNTAYVGNDGKVIKDYGKPHWVSGKYGWWYDNGDGTFPADTWKEIDGRKFHFDKNGYMQTGWIQADGNWYYLAADGAMLTGWINISTPLYYLDQDGVMQTGWLEYNGSTYYLKDSGAMAKGLQMIDGTQYFFNYGSGAMQDFPGYNIVFYSQKDPAWAAVRYGSYQFGSTGCGITSIAMALSSVLNQSILPTDVANYMYNNTNEFNWQCSGNSGMSNLLGAEHWGVNCDIIYSLDEMEQALSQGKIIAIMLNPGSFSPSGYTHEMILHGLSGGQTQAYDPLDGLHNGWHSTSQLWSEKSTDPYDLNVGTGVFAFY